MSETIGQLPVVSPTLATDTIPLFRAGAIPGSGTTYQAPISAILNTQAGYPLVFGSVTQSAALTNSVAEQFFNQPLYTVIAGTMNTLGALLRVRLGYSYTTSSTPNLTLKAYLGGTLAMTSGAVALSPATGILTSQFDLHTTLIGAAGTLNNGFIVTSLAGQILPAQAAMTGLNLTIGLPLTFSAQWSAATINDAIILTSVAVEQYLPVLTG
jgi:hypothetical protein